MAEEYGYKASLEVPTPDGHGQVDVLLEKEGKMIAVEISVTTSPEWELHNIQKCLIAGYEKVVVCSTSPAKLQNIQRLLKETLAEQEQGRVAFISPDAFQSVLIANQVQRKRILLSRGIVSRCSMS